MSGSPVSIIASLQCYQNKCPFSKSLGKTPLRNILYFSADSSRLFKTRTSKDSWKVLSQQLRLSALLSCRRAVVTCFTLHGELCYGGLVTDLRRVFIRVVQVRVLDNQLVIGSVNLHLKSEPIRTQQRQALSTPCWIHWKTGCEITFRAKINCFWGKLLCIPVQRRMPC